MADPDGVFDGMELIEQLRRLEDPVPVREVTVLRPVLTVPPDPLSCPECAAAGETFIAAAPAGLGSHRRRKHGVVGGRKDSPPIVEVPVDGFECPECAAEGVTFATRTAAGLGSHRLRRHNVRGGLTRTAHHKHSTIYLSDGDQKLTDFIQEFMGLNSQADAIRTAIRAYAMHIEFLSRKGGR